MSVTRKSFFVAAAAAAALGLSAPAASAGGTGDDVSSGLVNVADNNVGPVQACNNDVPVNAVGGQVPVDDIAGALGIGAHGNAAVVDNSCEQGDYGAD